MSARGFACIGLDRPKDANNIGGVLRAAGCYEADLIAVAGARYKRAATDTQAAHRHIPLIHTDNLHLVVPFDCVPVAIDLLDDATPLQDFVHPERAFYVFGPEDGTLGRSTTDWCKHKVYIPTAFCMNLAATVNVVLYDRLAKQKRSKH